MHLLIGSNISECIQNTATTKKMILYIKVFQNFQYLKATSEEKYAPTLINLNANLNHIYDYLESKLVMTDGLEYLTKFGFHILNQLMFIKIPLFIDAAFMISKPKSSTRLIRPFAYPP